MQAHTSNLLPFHWAVSLNMQAWLSDSIFTAWSNKYHPEWLFFLILGCLSSTSVRGIEWATVVAKSAEWFFEVPVLTREWYWAFVGFTQSTAKECSNYCTIALISRASKVSLKILQARFLQYVNRELSDVQARFRKGRGTKDQIANIRWITEKARVPEKHLLLLYLLRQSLWLCGSQQTVENSARDGNTRPSDLPPEKSVWRSRNSS